MSKKSDIYLQVLAAAKASEENPTSPMSCKLVIKIATPGGGHDLIGLKFETLQSVDSFMNALHAIRLQMTSNEDVHPILKGPTDGLTH